MKVTRDKMLEALKQDSNLHLFNGFYDNKGHEYIDAFNGYQVLQDWAAEHVSKNNKYFYAVNGGFATEYIYNKIFMKENKDEQ